MSIDDQQQGVLTLERRDHVLLMGLNRPERRNAFNIEMLRELAEEPAQSAVQSYLTHVGPAIERLAGLPESSSAVSL